MMAQPETPKTPPPESPTICGIAGVEMVPSQDGKLLRSQKPPRIQPPQPLTETPTKNFTDSGYTSLSATPNEKPPGINRTNSLRGGPIPLFFFKKRKVSFIDKPIDQSTRDRFKAIQPSFEKLLLEEMRSHQKPGTRYKPISTRLAMMGTSESDAQPHIAILCQPEQKRLIQAFVKKDIVVDIYRPKDLRVPVFEVIVFGNAPRLRLSESNIEVLTDAENVSATPRDTLCGIPISFQHPNGHRRNATFGGIIKVVTARGSIELLGMTAGHVLDRWDHDSDEDMLDASSPQNTYPASPSMLEGDGSFISGVTETAETNEDEYCEYELDYPFSEFPGALVEDGGESWDFQNPAILGELIDVFKEDAIRSAGQCYDWALFRPILYNMNRVPANPKAQLRICDKRPGTIENRPVIMMGGPTGCKVGSILSEPGRILLKGEEFIDAYIVSMSEEPGIRDGDSGSWVVDAKSFEVYGQLVASDMFGGGYVIPMADVFSDIKSHLGAQTVELPSFIDILHARTIAEEGYSVANVDENSRNVERAASITAPLMAFASEDAIEETLVMKGEMMGFDTQSATDRSDQRRFSQSKASGSSDPKYSPQSMSASISSRPTTPTLDHHGAFAILGPSGIPYGSLDSGYSSLLPSPTPGMGGTGGAQAPVAGTATLKEERRNNWRKRRLSHSQFLEHPVEKKQLNFR
ncbi:hypothetical protein F5B21DRAFT_527756 [Xylaria acuta]|nr:hypothetical protein F5B21DRAFT_527756 [Xylaria acuta]